MPNKTPAPDDHQAEASALKALADNSLGPLAKWPGLAAAGLAGVALAGMMLLMLFDVIGRYWFNSPVPGASELIEMGMGITVFAALPLVTLRNEHIQLDYFAKALRGRVRLITDAILNLISTGGMGLIAWRLALKAMTVIAYNDTTPFLRLSVGPVAVLIALCATAAALIFFAKALQLLGLGLFGRVAPTSCKGQQP